MSRSRRKNHNIKLIIRIVQLTGFNVDCHLAKAAECCDIEMCKLMLSLRGVIITDVLFGMAYLWVDST